VIEMQIRNVIKKLIETEKTSIIKLRDNKYTFMVDRMANKFQIKQAVELLFKVKVENIHTSNYLGKSKKVGMSFGYKNDWKKAIVKLVKGHEIKSIEEA
jgi:large subunit ribosomal protein L23